jgi:GNAT superfamily N-acetyltransferase
MFENCRICGPLEESVTLWETADSRIAAVLNPVDPDEAFIHIHPAFRTPELEEEMLLRAERTFANARPDGRRRLYVPVDEDDALRKEVLGRLGYAGVGNLGWEHSLDLDGPLPEAPTPPGFVVRSMGGPEEHPARSWCSWLAFHSDEPQENYDGDFSWYANLQRGPLYRRDLDVVAATAGGEIVSFSTFYYDDATRSAVCVLDGTAAPYWRRGLGRAALREGLRRLQRLGCTRVFAKAADAPADAFYGSVMGVGQISETWIKDYAL